MAKTPSLERQRPLSPRPHAPANVPTEPENTEHASPRAKIKAPTSELRSGCASVLPRRNQRLSSRCSLGLTPPSRNARTRAGLTPSPRVLGHRRDRNRASSMLHFRVSSTYAWDGLTTARPPWGLPPRLILDLVQPTAPPKRRPWHRTASYDAARLPCAFPNRSRITSTRAG